jgi:hypothetical protein
MMMNRWTDGFNRLEKLCLGFSFVGALLADFGALKLVELIDRHFRMETDLPAAAALIAFFGVLTLMLKGVDEIRGERIRRLIQESEKRIPR